MAPLLAGKPRSDRAFERMYEKHVGDVYRYVLVVLRNPDDAEDVTQTTFMNAYRAFRQGERPRKPQNWLITIAHNVCRQRFRQATRRPSVLPLQEELAEAQVPDEDVPTGDDIRRALGHLAFNQRAALVMRELEGRSYPEIATVLGVSTSAVETLIFRARRALREQLEGTLTCHEAELAISRQLDGRLARAEKAQLRAHLRECSDCNSFARSQRAQRSAIRSLAMIPLPSSLAHFFGHGGGAAAGAAGGAGASAGIGTALSSVGVKMAAVGVSAVVATGVGVEAGRKAGWHPLAKANAAAAPAVRGDSDSEATTQTAAAVAEPLVQAPAVSPKPVLKRNRFRHSPGWLANHGRRTRAAAHERATPKSDNGARSGVPGNRRPSHPVKRAQQRGLHRGLQKPKHHGKPAPKDLGGNDNARPGHHGGTPKDPVDKTPKR